MEILIGAVIALATQLLKKLTGQIGGPGVLVLVFAACLVLTFLKDFFLSTVSPEAFSSIIQSFGVAVGFYEAILKRIPWLGEDSL